MKQLNWHGMERESKRRGEGEREKVRAGDREKERERESRPDVWFIFNM